MSKKPLSKLLSLFLTVAICMTTMLGCFIAVNAAETPSYVITGAQCNENDTVASATVEFYVPQGMAAGIFTIDNTDNWYSSVAVSLYSELAAPTDNVNIDTDNGNVTFYITDADDNAKLYTNIVFKLDFVFADGGIQKDIDITISGLDFNGLYYDEIYTDADFTGINGQFTAGCKHAFVVNDDKVYTSDELGYTVYNGAVCSKCGEVKSDYQVVPETEDNDGEIVVYSGSASAAPAVELLDPNSTNSESNPYIIETPTQLHSLAMGALKNTAGEVLYNKGAYFKIADGISAFILQSSADTETIMNLSSADEVKTYLSGLSSKTSWWTSFTGSNGQFSGHFDGNGVEIYGLYGAAAGAPALFPVVSGTSSFKNFALKNSYIAADSGAGVAAIVGKTPNDTTVDIITFNNITVANNYIEQTGNRDAGASAIIGVCNSNTNSSSAAQKDAAKIYNCLVYGNELVNDAYTGTALKSGLITDCSGNSEIKNVISLGVTPWTLNSSGWYLKQINDGTIANVYTDATQSEWDAYSASNANNTVTNAQKWNINYAINADDLKGDKAAATTAALIAANKAANSSSKGTDLDWNTDTNPNGVWFTGNGAQYPTLLKKAALNVADFTNYEWKLLGVNIEYQNDGSFALNFHYEPSYDTSVSLYLANANEEYKSQILTEYTTSSFADTTLSADAKMFTVSNLSAKDMDILWLPTLVATSKAGDKVVYSETKQISITEYAKAVVLGEAFYSEDATASEKAADKNVAAALINYGTASSNALANTVVETDKTVIEKWDTKSDGVWGDWYDSSFDGKGDGTKNNPYIITSAEELAYLCRYGCDANVYYKVDESIAAFDMNTVSGVDLTVDNITAQQVKDAVDGKILGKVWFGDAAFKGNFDGSGVTIYGLCAGPAYYNQASFENGSTAGCSRAGLFPKIDASTAVIKNITIKNSYFKGDPAGAVFGETLGNGGSAVIENVVVANCYINSTGGYVSGVLGGYCLYNGDTNTADKVRINNALVYDNVVYNKDGSAARLVGTMEVYCDNGSGSKVRDYDGFAIHNTIAIGCNIENTGSWWQKDPAFYANCYTTQTPASENTTITQLASASEAQGVAAKTNMPYLNWDTVWLYGAEGEYPSIVPMDAMVNPISEYSGTPDTTSTLSGLGSSNDPYIIETADQFAAIALGKKVYAQGSYFKVKPGIKAFYMNGGGTVASMTSFSEVEKYFEANGGYDWTSSWDNSTADKSFSGHFDGSGVTIYGLYDVGDNAGLFEMAEDSSSFKNFALKNSYIKVGSGAGVAAVVGKVSKQTDPDIMTFENIIVANNHIEQTNTGSTGASIVLGYLYNSNDGISINKCVIYGNNLVNPNASASYGLVSAGGNGSASLYRIRNVVALGVKPYTNSQGYYLRVLDGNECFVNIYTDQDCSAMNNYSDTNKVKYNFNDNIDFSLLQGSNAVSTLGAEFDWNTTWFAGAYNDYPSLTPAGIIPSNVQALYDGMNLDKYDSFGNSTDKLGVYSTTLVLKANPYMSFIFALDDYRKYKGNGGDITITFSDSDGNTIESITANDMINSESNGRYHKYYLRDIPVISLSTGITVTANADGESYDLGIYSAEGFALAVARENRLNPCDYYSTRYNAAKALVFYTQMLAVRYGGNL